MAIAHIVDAEIGSSVLTKINLAIDAINALATTYAALDSSNQPFSGIVRQAEAWHIHAGFQAQDETITVGLIDTWVHITNVTNDLFTLIDASGLTLVDDTIVIAESAHYTGTISMTLSGSNGKDFQFRVYNVTQARQESYYIGSSTTGATNFVTTVLPIFIAGTAGDVLRLEIRCVTDASNPIVRSAVLNMHYVYDTPV